MTQETLRDLAPTDLSNLRPHHAAPVILTFLMASTKTRVFLPQGLTLALPCLGGLLSSVVRMA